MPGPRILTALTIALGASLLFVLEPMAAKQLLPVTGGSSAVWLTCLCFFQITLLLGYAYANLLARNLDRHPGGVAATHIFLLAVAFVWALFMLGSAAQLPASLAHAPALAIFLFLTAHLALPFFLLSATSPLLQVCLARVLHTAIPYRLFALSNLGSLAALLAYPSLIEPVLTLHHQHEVWIWAFALYAISCSLLVLRASRQPVPSTPPIVNLMPSESLPDRRQRNLLCFFLAAVGTIQLCAVTSHLTENIAAVPLLWVIPLAVYLFSFMLSFEAPSLYRREPVLRLLVIMIASLGYLLSKTDVSLPIGLAVLFFLAELFLACWVCHAELFRLRPSNPDQAATFYLILAAGGAAGTLFATLVVPLLTSANYDLPIAFTITAVAVLAIAWSEGWTRRLLWATSAILGIILITRLHTAYMRTSLFMARNFYGSLAVRQTDTPPQSGGSRLLVHGSISHGMQWFSPAFRTEPTTYYGRNSGIGLALAECCGVRPRRIGVIGLGAGTLAAYGRPGDTLRFYEINPLVETVARNLFTYLRQSAATVTIVDGDARKSLETDPSHFDVLAVDAFSGDAIPVHLLTVEALTLYRAHLASGGVIAFHISNQYLDLAPVVTALAGEEHLSARIVDSPGDADIGTFAAKWVLLADPSSPLMADATAIGTAAPPAGVRPWTDSYSSLLPVLRWSGGAH